jgi:hypothetical protein
MTSPLYSSRITKLWAEVRTRDYEIRNPVPLAYSLDLLLFDNFDPDFIHPMALKGKVRSYLSLTLDLRSFVPRTNSSRGNKLFCLLLAKE